jgi:hypothetical protein
MASTAYQRVFVCPLRLMTTRAVSIRQLDRRLTSQPRDVASRQSAWESSPVSRAVVPRSILRSFPLRSSLVPTWIVIDAHQRRRHRVPSNREFVKMMRFPTCHSASAGDSCTCAFTLICICIRTSKGTRRHTFVAHRTARLPTELVAESQRIRNLSD